MQIVKNKPVATWLFISAASVFLMALIGAITRLTESGLSIVVWEPVSGTLPPLNAQAWEEAFALYKQSPQYKLVNAGMSLDEFKKIFFWEWVHRLWGRLIGIIYAAPLVYFWVKGQIPAPAKKPLIGILILGLLQGVMGWFMVMSGLVDEPNVSHYRLAAHLLLAFAIFAATFYMALVFSVKKPEASPHYVPLRHILWTTFGLAVITMAWGAFTAGLRAGHLYADIFPMMGRNLWPAEIFYLRPHWVNFVENHAAVQFTHRALAVMTLVMAFLAATAKFPPARLSNTVKTLLFALLFAICAQAALGAATVMSHVNIVIATLHQAGAMTILAIFTAVFYHLPVTKE